MPSLSGPQHRAMEAAAHGISTLGIPKKVGEEFSKADKGKTFDQASLAPNAAIVAGMLRMPRNAAADAEFSESDHPRAPDGKFGDGSSASPMSLAEAKKNYEKDVVPKGWFTHGRSTVDAGKKDVLQTGNPIFMTKSNDIADQYAKKGSVHYLAPGVETDVHDLVDDPDGFAKIEKAFKRDFDRGTLPSEFDEVLERDGISDDPDAAWEAVKADFDPEDLVQSGGWYDTNVVSWLSDNFPAAFFNLTGGAVALSPDTLQRHQVRDGEHQAHDQALAPNAAIAAGAIRFAKKPAADTSVPGMLRMLGGKDAAGAEPEDQPKTLYIHRPLKNSEAIRAWAKDQGFKTTLPADDMHATIAFSKTPVKWSDVQQAGDNIAQEAGSAGRSIDQFDKGAVVLKFASPELTKRWHQLRGIGASWDHDNYQPHVTITYDAGDVDVSKIKPYDGPLEFGPEVMGEVKPGWANKVKANLQATDSAFTIAMDRDIQREKTRDGRLIIQRAHITKANVCPYRGEEIPGWEKLGLDPQRVYKLLRDPEEIRKAAPSLNGVQLLIKHTPVNAQDPHQDKTVGSIGTDAEFDGEYLDNSVYVNVQEAIDGIESGAKMELSAGYHYIPIMEPGVFRGQNFDGKMIDIVFNHVALVESGRAGPDCAV